MKIFELNLKRYGPFTDVLLDLSAGAQGLHVVFGRNEAGKSTTLRALTCLLFGIEHNTRDAFLHEMSQLRIGGRLQHSSGEEFSFVRKKGRSKTVISQEDDSPLDDAILSRFLSGVDRELFTSLYGIGHPDLVEGGRAILEQRGELGQALFSAALGVTRLRTLLNDFNNTANSLFLPTGKKPIINALVRSYKDELKTIKNATLNSSAWSKLHKDIKELSAEIKAARRELEQTQAEENQLKRIKRVFRPLRNLEEVVKELKTLEDVVELPEDFGEQWRSALQKLRNAQEAKTKLELKIADARMQFESMEVDESLLAKAADIQDLSEELGAYKKAQKDLPAQEAKRQQLRNQARDALGAFRPGMTLDEVAALKPQFSRRKVIVSLANEARELAVAEQGNLKSLRNSKNKLERIERKLSEQPAPVDFSELKTAVAQALKAGDIDARIEEARTKAHSLGKTCKLALKRLGLWTGELDEFETLSLPLPETVERFEKNFSANSDEDRRIREKEEEYLEERKKIGQELMDLKAGGEVPIREQLEDARSLRTTGWHLVRRAWLDGEDVSIDAAKFDAERPLEKAYEHSVHNADKIADTMYQEAKRIERHRSLTSRLSSINESLNTLAKELEKNHQARKKLKTQWIDLWQPVHLSPLEPGEMLAWLRRAEALRGKIETLREQNNDVQQLERSRKVKREALLEALVALDVEIPSSDDAEELTSLLSFAEERLEEFNKQLQIKNKLESKKNDAAEDLKQAEDEARDLRARRDQWQSAWRDAVAWLELGEDPSPDEVSAALEQLEEIFGSLKDADSQGRRIYGIEKVIEEFEQRVAVFAKEIGMLPGDESPAVFMGKLVKKLGAALKAEERRAALEEQLHTLEAEQRQLVVEIDATKAHLEKLKKQAAAETDAELIQIERESSRRRELLVREQELLQQLQENGDGHTVDELREESSGKDIDTLSLEIEGKTQLAKELRSKLDGLKDRRAELAAQDKRMRGSAAAAEAKERASQILAKMRSEVERYLRARMAAHILEEQIERFRRENQTPLLARASQIFSKLTLGAYAGLRDDLDDKGTPIVLGVRPDEKEVPVAGMSDGTCDQLFLSLRLAALESHLHKAEPMPFVVDDILIGFDDERSRAALEVLGDLASKTQVIVFTHHARVTELAKSLSPKAGAFVHEIGS